MEANVRKHHIALSFLMAAIVLVMAFAIGTILHRQEAEAKPNLNLCQHLYGVSGVITPATCTSTGLRGQQCELCGMTKNTTTIAALGHSYGSWRTTTAATCGKKGSQKRTCTRSGCSAYETQTIPATGNHAYALDNYIMTQPTCTTSGQYGSKCANCAATKAGSSIPKLGHDYQYSTTPATCILAGLTKTTCSRCTYSSKTTIPKKGHAYASDVLIGKNATCTESGYYLNQCANCGGTTTGSSIPKLGHSYGNWTTVTNATCTKTGTKRRTCSRCSDVETDTISKAPHVVAMDNVWITRPTCTSGGQYGSKCANCSHTEPGTTVSALGHDYRYSTKNATCTAAGSTTTTCSRCTYSSTTTIPKKGHAYAMDALIGKNATCTESGYYLNQCANCKGTTTGSSIPKLGHSYGNWSTVTNATCTKTGSEKRTCSRCSNVETRDIAKKAHVVAMDNVWITRPTCTSGGQYGSKCANCSHTEPGTTVSALGHTGGTATCTTYAVCTRCGTPYGNLKAHAVAKDNVWITAPTCTSGGQYGSKCANCSHTEPGTTVSALGHSWSGWTVTRDATCKFTGSKYRTCSRCDKKETVTIGVKPHQMGFQNGYITEPKCTSAGQYANVCAQCGYKEPSDTIPALGHDWSDGWIIDKGSTCWYTGDKHRVCKRCSFNEKGTVELAPHQLAMDNYIITAATCTKVGQLGTACANVKHCGHIIPGSTYGPLGHDYTAWSVTKAATCTTDGSQTRTCQRDGCSASQTQPIPKLGHLLAYNHSIGLAPTCENNGYYLHVCMNQKCLYTETGDTIPYLGHDWSGWTVTRDATCLVKGSKYRTCGRAGCGKKETVEIPIKPHAMGFQNGYITEPKCETPGQYANICANCGYKEPSDVAVALGHKWSNWTVIKDSTCYRTGTKKRTCGRADCGKVETGTIPIGAHQVGMDNIILKAPTCTESGYYGNACAYYEFCGYATTGSGITPSGHNYKPTGEKFDGTCQSQSYTVEKCERLKADGTMCGHTRKVYGATNPNVHELLSLREEQATCTKPGAIYQYCAHCKKDAYKEKDIPAPGHQWPYACTATCTRTVNGATCGAANPNRQDHNYAETISGRTHTFKCTWCGYSYYYVDAAGEYVLSGVWKWNAAETPDPHGTLCNEWHPFWLPDSIAKPGEYLLKGDHPDDVVIIDLYHCDPFCEAEIVIPFTNGFKAGGNTYYGLRIRPGQGLDCCYYEKYQVIGLYYLSDLSYNGMRGGTLVGHQEQNVVGHTHEHNGWEWMQWQQRSLATLDFGEGTAVSATAYQFIQWNAYQLQSQYTIDIYRQKPNVSMSGNFNTDKANNKYEYYTTLTFTEPQSVNITPAYPTYQGFNLVYKSYDSITLGEGRQALIAYYNRLPADVTLNLVGGSSSSSTSKTMYYGDTIAQQLGGNLPTPTRAGFKFLGWTRTAKQGSKDYVSNTSTITLGDVSYGSLTLYAQWECQHLTLSDLTVTTKGTCTTDGSGYRTCATPGCDYALRNNKLPKEKYTVTEVIPAREHSWATSLTHDAQSHWYNCTNEENALYTGCVSFTDKATHTYVTMTDATCTENGVEKCTFCGHERIINHLGHNWSSTYWHNETGHWHKCTRCQVNCTTACSGTASHACPTCGSTSTATCGHTAHTHATAHTYKTTKAATCTTDGVETCTVCGHTRAISHLGHNWSSTYTTDASNHWHECTRCGVDCYTACVGGNEYGCNDCGATSHTTCGHYAHTHGKAHDWVITTYPNCTTKGTATCSVCGRTTQDVSKVPELDILGHLWSDWQYTCGESWCDSASCKHYKVCVRDNCPGNAGGKPAINDHASHTWVYSSNSDRPTCTADGIQTCSVCGHVRVIAHTGHTWSSQWQHNEYDHWHKCSTCGETCYYPCCDIHACTQHTSGDYHYAHKWVITKHPTCEDTGTRKCDICGRTETLDATGHDFSGDWDASNVNGHWHICNNTNLNNGVACTETDGPFAHDIYAACEENACWKCSECGYVTDATHNYSYPCDTDCNDCGWTRSASHSGVPAAIPSEYVCEVCQWCGETTKDYHDYDYECDTTCNTCGYVRDAHHYGVPAAEATACERCAYCNIITDASHEYSYLCDTTCNNCGYERFAQHSWIIDESRGGTCLRPSYYRQHCEYCGTVEEGTGLVGSIHEGSFVPVAEADACYRWDCCGLTDPEHSMKEEVVMQSTCIDNGYTQIRCEKCNYTVSGHTLALNPDNHPEGAHSIFVGSADIHTQWSCCGKLISSTHDLQRVTTLEAATCTTPRISYYECVCGYSVSKEDAPPLGHNPGKGDGYRAPTCESDGETGRGYCTVCGVTLESSMTIPALGHNFIGEAVNTGTGSHYFKCERYDVCGAYGVGSVKDATSVCTGGTARCEEAARCDLCKQYYGEPLGHSFTGEFEAFNNTKHWHICDRSNCNAISERTSHILTTRTVPVSNTAPGYKYDTCECGYEHKYDYTYRLIVNLDGGDWNPSGRPSTQLIFDGKTGETVTLPNPTKLNHKFDGWSLTGGGTISGTTYTFGDSHGTATALWLNMFYIDLNGSLNGESFSSLVYNNYGKFTFATADIYVDGVLVANDVTDYYTMHVYGSSYRVVVTAKPGYNFDGKNTKEFTGTIGAADISIKPAASSNTYKITIDLNPSATTTPVYTGSNPITGTWDERTSVTSNVTIPNPTMPGYKFTGWTITENGVELNSGVTGTAFKNLTSALNGEVVFTATWEAVKVQYKVHHYLMNTDGKTYALKESETFYKYADATHTIADDANSYDGFTYANGKVFQTGGTEGGVVTKVVIDADGTVNINLYYTRNQYTLTIDPNNGTWNGSTNKQTFTQYHGTDKAIPAPTRTGYTFTGWTLKGPGSYADGTYTFGIGDAELEAQWTPNVYNIVYDLNDISGTQTPKFGTKHPATGTYDAWVYIDNPSMVGYQFIGWEITGMDGVTHFYGNDTENCNTTTANSVSSTMATVFKNLTSLTVKDGGTVTFKALWKANTYKIVYDLNDVSPSQDPVHSRKPTSAKFDQTFTTEPASMTGYKFVGWTITGMDGVTHFIGANSTDGETIAGITDTTFMNLTSVNDGKVTFTAMWEPNTYTVTLNPGNGRVNPATITVTYDQQYGTLPTPVRIGYDFTGWYNAETNGTKITDATSVTTPENHTLYAGWQRSTYTITYVLNGGYYDGNPTITQHYLSGTSITLITPQAPASKTFVGWFTSYNNSTGMYSGGIGMGGDTYMLTESITVYACYVDKHDLGITVNDIYGEIKVGSQFMTSATIVNNNLMSIIPTDNLKVVMKVYVNGVVNPSMTQVFTNQIVPGKGTQLVSAVINTSTWSNSNTYQIEWSIDTSGMTLYTEEVSTNNVSKTISFKPGQYRTITNTERPGYSTTRPGSFQNLTAPSTSTTRYEWTYWTWNNGGFVELNGNDQLDITLLLKPENESGLRDYTAPDSLKYLHNYTTRSGYGLSIHTYFCPGCGKALGNATTCGSCRTAGVTSNVQANTNIGTLEVVMTFPEFNYSTANNNCAVFHPDKDKARNMYPLMLPMYADYNSSDANDKRAHYTPMWMPDGQYTPVTYISGLWTPFGELTATVRQGQYSNSADDMNRLHIWSNAIILDGSLYDDLYGN